MKNLFINLPIKLSLFHLKIKFHRNKSKRKGRYSTLTCHKNFIPSKKSTRQNLANSLSPKETNFEDRLTLLSNFQPNYPFPTFPFFELTSLSFCVYAREQEIDTFCSLDSWPTISTFPTFRIRPRTNETDAPVGRSIAIYAHDHAISRPKGLAEDSDRGPET